MFLQSRRSRKPVPECSSRRVFAYRPSRYDTASHRQWLLFQRVLGSPRILIERNDCTALSSGGERMHKLEFIVTDALAKGTDTLITQGAVQSSHAR